MDDLVLDAGRAVTLNPDVAIFKVNESCNGLHNTPSPMRLCSQVPSFMDQVSYKRNRYSFEAQKDWTMDRLNWALQSATMYGCGRCRWRGGFGGRTARLSFLSVDLDERRGLRLLALSSCPRGEIWIGIGRLFA